MTSLMCKNCGKSRTRTALDGGCLCHLSWKLKELERKRDELQRSAHLLKRENKALRAEVERLREGHCFDCCCARSWRALGLENAEGVVGSIPEHIEQLKADLDRARANEQRTCEGTLQCPGCEDCTLEKKEK